VRVEGYRPPIGDQARRAARRARGLAEVPQLIVVSASLDLPDDHPAFGDPHHPPLIVTHGAADPRRIDHLRDRAEVLQVGSGPDVDLPSLLGMLAARGAGRVLCEGGPRLAGALLAGGLIDEVFLTLAPTLVGGAAVRIVHDDVEVVRDLELVELHEHEGELLLRYRRPDRVPPASSRSGEAQR
jgi:riboflavin biosynthesis pyrimidine reductase